MKKTAFLSSFFFALLFSCTDKKEEPVPELPAPKLEGKWEYKSIHGFYNDPGTNSFTRPAGYLLWTNTSLEFVPSSTNLNFYLDGSLVETGQYSIKNNKLSLTLDTLNYEPTQVFHIDSLTTNYLVFRDSTINPATGGFTFNIHRLKR